MLNKISHYFPSPLLLFWLGSIVGGAGGRREILRLKNQVTLAMGARVKKVDTHRDENVRALCACRRVCTCLLPHHEIICYQMGDSNDTRGLKNTAPL